MRTFNEWDENRVGFLEVDLVAHTTVKMVFLSEKESLCCMRP
ncbi:MAG: hypothetical protein N3A56_05055 [Thermodesulfobacteriaceae bacterium]|nr:hypothetical protein [Thermodesulfobacteriaceae bacterium]